MFKLKERLTLAAAFVMTNSAIPLMAQTSEESQLTSAILGILGPVARIGGIATLGFGLIWGFKAYGDGDEDRLESAKKAVMGGIGMLLVVTIANLITKSAGVGTTLR